MNICRKCGAGIEKPIYAVGKLEPIAYECTNEVCGVPNMKCPECQKTAVPVRRFMGGVDYRCEGGHRFGMKTT
jgi:lysyl-tRNA synthetase class I